MAPESWMLFWMYVEKNDHFGLFCPFQKNTQRFSFQVKMGPYFHKKNNIKIEKQKNPRASKKSHRPYSTQKRRFTLTVILPSPHLSLYQGILMYPQSGGE